MIGAALYASAPTGDHHSTPREFYLELDREFGFVLDVCASAANHQAPMWYGLDHPDPARRNALAISWVSSGAMWCNPPYGRGIGEWMRRCLDASRRGHTVVALVPARTDTAWFHDYVLAPSAEIRYVRGRLKFGGQKNSAPFPSAVVVYKGAK